MVKRGKIRKCPECGNRKLVERFRYDTKEDKIIKKGWRCKNCGKIIKLKQTKIKDEIRK